MFPGQQIRLDFNTLDGTFKNEIKNVKWTILKESKNLFEIDGLTPTIKLPTTERGIYQLKISILTSGGKSKKGDLNFYEIKGVRSRLCTSHSRNGYIVEI